MSSIQIIAALMIAQSSVCVTAVSADDHIQVRFSAFDNTANLVETWQQISMDINIENPAELVEQVEIQRQSPLACRFTIENSSDLQESLIYTPHIGHRLYFDVVRPDGTRVVFESLSRSGYSDSKFYPPAILQAGDSIVIETYLFEYWRRSQELDSAVLSPLFSEPGSYSVKVRILPNDAYTDFVPLPGQAAPWLVADRCIVSNSISVSVQNITPSWTDHIDFNDLCDVIYGRSTFESLGITQNISLGDVAWLNWLEQNQPAAPTLEDE